MPPRKNNQGKTDPPARTTKSKRTVRKKPVPPVVENEQPDTAAAPYGPPWAYDPGARLSDRDDMLIEADEETILYFLSHYLALERAIVRAGFTRAGRTPGTPQPDWPRFARHIQSRFDRDSSPVIQGAVAYLLLDQDNLELRNDRIENSYPWENPDPHNDTVWLSELIQQTSRKLIHGLNFPGSPVLDVAVVSAALFIVDAWAELDPEVERYLKQVQ